MRVVCLPSCSLSCSCISSVFSDLFTHLIFLSLAHVPSLPPSFLLSLTGYRRGREWRTSKHRRRCWRGRESKREKRSRGKGRASKEKHCAQGRSVYSYGVMLVCGSYRCAFFIFTVQTNISSVFLLPPSLSTSIPSFLFFSPTPSIYPFIHPSIHPLIHISIPLSSLIFKLFRFSFLSLTTEELTPTSRDDSPCSRSPGTVLFRPVWPQQHPWDGPRFLTHRLDVMWCDMIWCDMIWCDMIWCDVMWYGVMWFDVIWCDLMWCDMIWCDVTWYDRVAVLYITVCTLRVV